MAHPDPLHLAPEALDPELAYQWFRISIFGEADDSLAWRAHGWSPVARKALPDQPSNDDSVIRIHELQLYCRPKAVVAAARLAGIDAACADYQKVEELCGRAPYSGPALFSRKATRPAAGWSEVLPLAERSRRPLLWVERNHRGRVVTIHEEALHPRLAPGLSYVLAARQYRLTRWRIVYMPRGETEQADYMWLSYAEWAWAKIDLVREGELPSYRTKIVRPRHVIHLHFSCPSARALGTKLRSTWNKHLRKARQ